MLLLFFGLEVEIRNDKRIGVMVSKSVLFSGNSYYISMIYSRFIRYGVYVLTSTLFIGAGSIVDVILNSLAVTFVT
jgi:hypothetical protein